MKNNNHQKGEARSVRKLTDHHNIDSAKNLSDACTYDVEASPVRKDSSKFMKNKKRSDIKDERRKGKVEFTDTSVADMLSKMMKQQSAQEIDFDVFDRNPLNLYYFIAVFREAAEKKIEDPRGRLIRLIKYTTGEGKDLIKNCIQLPANDSYEAAKNKLYYLYVDPHRVIAAYQKEIKHWPQVKQEMLNHTEDS